MKQGNLIYDPSSGRMDIRFGLKVMTQRNKLSSRLLALILAMLMIVSMIPATVFAAPASDIPDEMLDNVYLDALAYTGYQVQAQKNDGTIYKT